VFRTLVLMACVCAVSLSAGFEDDWEEWGETKEKRREVDMRRLKNRGAIPNIPPPPGMDPVDFADKLAGSMGGSSGGKLFFVKLNNDIIKTKEDGKKLAKRWTDMTMNGGLNVQIFPVDETQIVIQSQTYDIQLAKNFFLKQRECLEVSLDSSTFTRKDLSDDDSEEDEL